LNRPAPSFADRLPGWLSPAGTFSARSAPAPPVIPGSLPAPPACGSGQSSLLLPFLLGDRLMGGRFLFELIPYRSSGLLRLFALGMAALLFLPHQVNKAVQHSRVTVQRITTANRIGVVVSNCLSPFLSPVGLASIPSLTLDGVGQDQHNPVQTIGLNHTFGGILVKVHPIKMFPHRRFNSLLALEIGPVGSRVLFQFSMLRRIGGSVRISRRCPQFLFGSAYIIGSVLNTIPHHI